LAENVPLPAVAVLGAAQSRPSTPRLDDLWAGQQKSELTIRKLDVQRKTEIFINTFVPIGPKFVTPGLIVAGIC